MASMPPSFSLKARRTTEQPISFLMAAAVQNPELISFAAGLVDPWHLPAAAVQKIADDLLGNSATAQVVLQYGTTHGLARLRKKLVDRAARLDEMTADDLSLTADHCIMTTGSQQSLYLLGDVLLDPGDIVYAADPTYFVMTGTLQSLGADVRGVPMDEDGLDIDALDEALSELDHDELAKVKIVYVQTYHQNPTGLTLSAERRPQVLEVVKKHSKRAGHRIILLEDAAYRELNYDAPPPPTIKSLDTENLWVAQCQTFSKPFAPGLKLGYCILPTDLVDPVLQQKGNHDFGGANLTQHIADRALDDGSYDAQVEKLCVAYRKKRDAVLQSLEAELGEVEGVSWTHPTGGLYVWLTMPEHLDTGREGPIFTDCVKKGVMYVPGVYARLGSNPPSHDMRLSFGNVDPTQIETGIARLASVIKSRVQAAMALA